MSIRRARLLHPLLRLMVLAALVLGVLAAPMASALGDVHALAHGHADLDDAQRDDHGHGDDGNAGTPSDDAGDLLHALMHSGHCHGHGTALMPTLAWQPLPAAQIVPVPGAATAYRSHLLQTPLRPPIAA